MIEINVLTKTRRGQTILDHLSLTLPDRGLVCVTGPSGCGKTSFANIVAGIDCDYSGSVRVRGTDLSELNPDERDAWRRDTIGFVFQDFQLIEGLDAEGNILLAAELHEAPGDEIARRRADDLLDGLGLGEMAQRPVETLSGGERQRVSIARALMWDAPIIIADEPTGSLDAESAQGVMDALRGIARDRLVLMVTHDQNLLPAADIVAGLQSGRAVIERGDEPSVAKSTRDEIEPAIEAGTCGKNPAGKAKRRAGRSKGLWKGPGGAMCSIRRHMGRTISIAALFAICGALTCAALASGQAVERAIDAFERANVGFYSGFVESAEDGLVDRLKSDPRVAAAWEQRPFGPVDITIGGASASMERKVPLPRANESLSFGSMPRREKREIALSPSLARKFTADISSLVGRDAQVSVDGQEFSLTVSGIYNAGYDDMFLSSDIEERLCMQSMENATAVSFEVESLEDISDVHRELEADGIDAVDASDVVSASLESFEMLRLTFSIVSGSVAAVSLAAGAVLAARGQASRSSEFGLRRALGFTRRALRGLCLRESLVVALVSSLMSALIMAALPFAPLPGGGITPSVCQMLFGICCAAIGSLVALGLAGEAIMRKPIETLLSSD